MYSSRTLKIMKSYQKKVSTESENELLQKITDEQGDLHKINNTLNEPRTITDLDAAPNKDTSDYTVLQSIQTTDNNLPNNVTNSQDWSQQIIELPLLPENNLEEIYIFPFPESNSQTEYINSNTFQQELKRKCFEGDTTSSSKSSEYVPESPEISSEELDKDDDRNLVEISNFNTDLIEGVNNKSESVLTEANNIPEFCGNMSEGRKRRHTADPEQWSKNRNKKLRMKGKEYIGYSRSKLGVVKHNVKRKPKKIGPTCSSKECLRSNNRKCLSITEDARHDIFEKFWSTMNWEQRKIFVAAHVTRIPTKRNYTEGESKRKNTLIYTLTIGEEKLQICKKMFLSTLSLGEFTVHSWVKNSEFGMTSSQEILNKSRRKSLPKNKQDSKEYLINFFNLLPKLPSHYGRHDTSKLYLEQTIQSLAQLFRLYCNQCVAEGKSAVSRTVFSELFYSMNLSLHQIKKDKCNVCTSHEVGNVSDAEWATHVQKKDRARLEKTKDKEDAKEKKCRLLTMDLQAVKVAPCLRANAIFFKTKLSCHNFTMYDVNTHHTTCFWFTETECDLTASTFVTCIMKYLETHCANETVPIIIFSDGCTYQNRNVILANALLSFAVDKNMVILQKYLEPGHTQMECDSVHSCIERKLKGRDINLPSDYLAVTKEARRKPFPYDVLSMKYDQFKDYTAKQFYRYPTIRPGKTANDPVITDIRAIKYTPEGKIFTKLDFDAEWKELPHRLKFVPSGTIWPQLYKEQRKIKYEKWKHLQELKNVIPADCHLYYDFLPHDNKSK